MLLNVGELWRYVRAPHGTDFKAVLDPKDQTLWLVVHVRQQPYRPNVTQYGLTKVGRRAVNWAEPKYIHDHCELVAGVD